MKECLVLYFNAQNEWNAKDETRGKWLLGEFDGYITDGSIDAQCVTSDCEASFETLEEAIVALRARVKGETR